MLKNDFEKLILSITINCATVFEQIQTKPKITLEFGITQPKETILMTPPMPIKGFARGPEGSAMNRLTNVEVHNSIFNITEENRNFEFY